MAARQPRSLFSRAASWLGTHVATATVAIAGAVFYGVLRVSYANFYARFDVEPEEVGLGQTEIVIQTGLLLLVSMVFVGVVMGAGFLIMKAMGAVPATDVAPDASLFRRALAFSGTPYSMIVVPAIFILALLVLVSLPGRGRSLADRVEKGETVRPPVSLTHWDLYVKALPATLTSLSGNDLPRQLRSHSLRYLGKADGVLVLYDWRTEKTFRLPMSSVVVTTSN
jgi:hypothetical protein